MELYYLGAPLAVVAAGVGAYFGAYLKMKGENLATHEDIGRLVDQVTAVTKATKEIEAKISNEVWDRQRRWEMKRDALFDVVKRLEAANDALSILHSAQSVLKKSGDSSFLLGEVSKAVDVLRQAFKEFHAAVPVALLVCGPEVRIALRAAKPLMSKTAKEVFDGNLDGYEQATLELLKVLVQVSAAVRKELGIDEAP